MSVYSKPQWQDWKKSKLASQLCSETNNALHTQWSLITNAQNSLSASLVTQLQLFFHSLCVGEKSIPFVTIRRVPIIIDPRISSPWWPSSWLIPKQSNPMVGPEQLKKIPEIDSERNSSPTTDTRAHCDTIGIRNREIKRLVNRAWVEDW